MSASPEPSLPRPHSSLFELTASRPVAITMMALAAVVFGVVGLLRLPVNLLPDISYPSLTIRTRYPGAAPQDVEERVSERVQEAVAVIQGVRRVYSVSRPEVSDVILEFNWGTRMVFAVEDVRERLDRIQLPQEAEDPLVLRYDPSLDPVLTLGLSGPGSQIELRRIAEEEIERELAEVDGVAAVKLRGGDEEEIRISVDEAALTAYRLDASTISGRLRTENLNAAAGSIDEGNTEYLVRALNEFRTLEEIEDLILVRRGDVSLRLKDVAKVRRVPQDKEVISRVDGQPCVLVDIYKEADANVVELCRKVKERVFGTQKQQSYVAEKKHEAPLPDPEPAAKPGAGGPPRGGFGGGERMRKLRERQEMTNYLAFQVAPLGVQMTALQDQSHFIETAVDDVVSAAVQGGLIAIVIIYLFLRRFAPTAIIAASIPISLVVTFAPMFLSRITLNVMSLGGLALGVGMLVDNSIVVLESISWCREKGMSRREAAVQGVRRVAGAVAASTLTTVAVFFPIVFVEGMAGQLFKDQSLAVVYSLLVSLVVALFLIPMLATREPPAPPATEPPPPARGWIRRPLSWIGASITFVCASALRLVLAAAALAGWVLRLALTPLVWAFQAVYVPLDRAYRPLLRGALAARPIVVLLAIGLFALALSRLPHLGTEMLPEVHQGEVFLDAFLRRDATVERTDEVMAPIEAAIAKLPDVESTFLASGVDKDELNDSDQGEHSARILVRMKANEDRVAQEERVRSAIRDLVRDEPRVQSYRFTHPSVLSFEAPLVVEVLGRDLVQLRQVCEEVVEAVKQVPGLRDVRSTLQRGNPEVSLRLDRDKLAALQLDLGGVIKTLQNKILGDVPTRFPELERKIDMRVRLDRDDLETVSKLLQINVNPAGTPPVPLGSIAAVHRQEGPSEIRRLGNMRGAEVQASLAGFDLGRTQERVEDALGSLRLPRDVAVRLGGQKEDMAQSIDSLRTALLLAVFLVYIVMAAQFESIVQPFVILLTVPLAVVGVVLALDLLSIPVSVIVMLGGIVLAGVVVNNAIILIDQINQLRAAGMAKFEAIVEGAHSRLRPVLMTTLTTVVGLLPLTGWLAGVPFLGGSGEGLELRAPMAITIVTGLSTATLLTLLVIPVVYSLSDRKA
ncbi:MAG: efflux RND transporter permease subunit [Planctomycetota bacterium]